MALIWFLLALSMEKPAQVATRMISIKKIENNKKALMIESELLKVKGVRQAKIIISDNIAYLKVESKILNEDDLLKFAS